MYVSFKTLGYERLTGQRTGGSDSHSQKGARREGDGRELRKTQWPWRREWMDPGGCTKGVEGRYTDR